MSEGEKEIMVHILAIEAFIISTYNIKRENWNEVIENAREQIYKQLNSKEE